MPARRMHGSLSVVTVISLEIDVSILVLVDADKHPIRSLRFEDVFNFSVADSAGLSPALARCKPIFL